MSREVKPWFQEDSSWLHYECDEEIVELMRRTLPALRKLYDALERQIVEAASDERFGEMFVLVWLYADVSNLVTEIETRDADGHTVKKEGWEKILHDVREGTSDGVLMHVDTLRLLDDGDWDDLKEIGLDVGSFMPYKKGEANE